MGRGHKKDISPKMDNRHMKSTNHEAIANQRHKEISPDTCQNSYYRSQQIMCWQGCGEMGTLVHYWWDCKLV